MNNGERYPPAVRGTIIVWGFLASYPYGGMTWQVLHYLVGLRRCGFDVWYVEESDRPVRSPKHWGPTVDYKPNVEYLKGRLEEVGLGDRWVFRPPGEDFTLGHRDHDGLLELYRASDAVWNLCGAQELRPWHRETIGKLVYIQTDPVEAQVAVAKGDIARIEELGAYDYRLTYGENLGSPDCRLPVSGDLEWIPTRPPVITHWWSTGRGKPASNRLTTVATWKSKGKDVEWNGEPWRWSKHHEFERFLSLPSRTDLPMEIAVSPASAEILSRLKENGWRTLPASLLADPMVYREYIQDSMGEFTVAKEQYVRSRSGWFSDRSVCYLAAARPVITQDTGFANRLPTGRGLLVFSTLDEAVDAIEALAFDYPMHSRAAFDIATETFDAELVLGEILDAIDLG